MLCDLDRVHTKNLKYAKAYTVGKQDTAGQS